MPGKNTPLVTSIASAIHTPATWSRWESVDQHSTARRPLPNIGPNIPADGDPVPIRRSDDLALPRHREVRRERNGGGVPVLSRIALGVVGVLLLGLTVLRSLAAENLKKAYAFTGSCE